MSRQSVIADVAGRLGTVAVWLDNLIRFESGYNTAAKNPNSSARGLIQLTDAPARELGFSDSLDAVTKFPGFEEQMYHVVMPYLQMQAQRSGSLDTEQALYMSVFYPSYMHVDPETQFPAAIQEKNKPIKTPLDYINLVRKRAGMALLSPKSLPVLLAAIGTGLLVWHLLRRSKGRKMFRPHRKNPLPLWAGLISPLPGPWL